ncbi:MAG: transglycosylase SLT domain-containing protein, partial [Actinomycetota bacterium]|nr:transglycosylase SLT domain-containing protein [Actinomycetota bacterium]
AASRKADADRAARAARAAERQSVVANAQGDPKSAARLMLADHGWGTGQWSCLEQLWSGESNWNFRAANSSSGAYGIPQSLPASKMASVGADYRTNPVTQITWGMQYIQSSYGTPCNALSQWQSRSPHWY